MFVAAAGSSLMAIIALGAADALVWSPEAIAPDWSAAHIFAALSPQDRWGGIAAVVRIVWRTSALSRRSGERPTPAEGRALEQQAR
jgi:hypothetical protein